MSGSSRELAFLIVKDLIDNSAITLWSRETLGNIECGIVADNAVEIVDKRMCHYLDFAKIVIDGPPLIKTGG